MTRQTGEYPGDHHTPLEIAEAVEAYVAKGGAINVVSAGETRKSAGGSQDEPEHDCPTELQSMKLEQLKGLVAKGAGVTAIQYSLRMNRKEIRRLASENGVKIVFRRPLRNSCIKGKHDTLTVSDTVAGHAMHYSSLGYTVPEIAQLLDLSVREVWNIGRAYRFEFKNLPTTASRAAPPRAQLTDSSRCDPCLSTERSEPPREDN